MAKKSKGMLVTVEGPIAKWLYQEEMTQAEFANLIELTPQYCNEIINGKQNNPKADKIYAIHKLTGISLDELHRWFDRQRRVQEKESA